MIETLVIAHGIAGCCGPGSSGLVAAWATGCAYGAGVVLVVWGLFNRERRS